MITGFQLDSKNKPIPVGLRIILTLSSPGEKTVTFSISSDGEIENYLQKLTKINPNFGDEIWIEPTPESKSQRFIVHAPADQRILLGDFPIQISFEITVERKFSNQWMTTNKVLIILNDNQHKIFQAREFTESYQKNDLNSGEELNDESSTATETLLSGENQTHAASEISGPLNQSTKARKKFSRPIRLVAGLSLILPAVFLLTPLSLFALDQPDDRNAKLAITLPATESAIGETIVALLVDQNGNAESYLGTVENKSTTAYLLRTGDNFIQVEKDQVQGRVIISFPFVGLPF